MFFAPFAVYVVHTLEERPGFAAWVSQHIAPMSMEAFALGHIPLILLMLWCSWRASRPEAGAGWVIAAVAFGVRDWYRPVSTGLYSPDRVFWSRPVSLAGSAAGETRGLECRPAAMMASMSLLG
ncbi:hypothetical protein IU479_15240 [Nocardia abscessus]|uniref:hypothetical protein n=1 Tax=Nocardia TaxID=1817 RepID=UPI0007A565A9|nr:MULTISPECIES: hypothetical protein [Nocardia]MBF6219465.1 hypothetical protein [Nocardia abscessus]